MTRFSMKELSKNVKTETIIPDDYTELKKCELIRDTPKAFMFDFTYLDKSYESVWFPKSFVIVKDGKYYFANWLLKKHTELL